jgi:hypothetical protein
VIATLAGVRVVTPAGVVAEDGWRAIDGEMIEAVGGGTPPTAGETFDLTGRWLLRADRAYAERIPCHKSVTVVRVTPCEPAW